RHFTAAVQRTPDCASAYVGIADCFLLLGDAIIGGMDAVQALQHAGEAARRALDLDADCAAAHAALGVVAWRLHWDWSESERRLNAAIALDASCVTAHLYRSWLLQACCRPRQAEEAVRIAERLDPASSFI